MEVCVCVDVTGIVIVGVMVTDAVGTGENVFDCVWAIFVGVCDGVTRDVGVLEGVYALDGDSVEVCVIAGVDVRVAVGFAELDGVTTAETDDVPELATVEENDAATDSVRVFVSVYVCVGELETDIGAVKELDGV